MARMNDAVPSHLRPDDWHELLDDLLSKGWGFWPVYNELQTAAGRAQGPAYIAAVLKALSHKPVIGPTPAPRQTAQGDQPSQGARGTRAGLPNVVHTADLPLRTRGIGRTLDAHPYQADPYIRDFCRHCQLPPANRIHTVAQ